MNTEVILNTTVCAYVHMCSMWVHVFMCVCVCVCMYVQRPEVDICLFSPYFLRHGLLPNLIQQDWQANNLQGSSFSAYPLPGLQADASTPGFLGKC